MRLSRNPSRFAPAAIHASDRSATSRRSLENLFRRELSSSVAAEIRNARLDHLSREISSSDAPLAEVCVECGWPYAAHAMRLFKRHFGMTMREWREKQPSSHSAVGSQG